GHAFEQGHRALGVAVDAHAEVDLLGVGIGDVEFGQPQDRVPGRHLHVGEEAFFDLHAASVAEKYEPIIQSRKIARVRSRGESDRIAARPRPGPSSSSGTRRRVPSTLRSPGDRKSTRLNSSHGSISYAGFCLKEETA